jgi:hypothetical protein
MKRSEIKKIQDKAISDFIIEELRNVILHSPYIYMSRRASFVLDGAIRYLGIYDLQNKPLLWPDVLSEAMEAAEALGEFAGIPK